MKPNEYNGEYDAEMKIRIGEHLDALADLARKRAAYLAARRYSQRTRVALRLDRPRV